MSRERYGEGLRLLRSEKDRNRKLKRNEEVVIFWWRRLDRYCLDICNILERINHADVVKRAKRLGVSTEGSTIDILERINRKEMEKYNY